MLLPDFFMDGLVKTMIDKMFPTIPRIPKVLRNTPHITFSQVFSEFPPFGGSGHTKPVHSFGSSLKMTRKKKWNSKLEIS